MAARGTSPMAANRDFLMAVDTSALVAKLA